MTEQDMYSIVSFIGEKKKSEQERRKVEVNFSPEYFLSAPQNPI